jgi:hypothetical protein
LKLHHLICFNISVLITLVISSLPSHGQVPNQTSQDSQVKFVCEKYEGVPTTVVKTEKGTIPILKYESTYFSSSGYTQLIRCHQISDNFQRLYSQGKLKYIASGYVHESPVICGVEALEQSCSVNNVLFTLPQSSTSKDITDIIISVGTAASQNPLSDLNFTADLHGDPTTPPPPPPVKPFIIVDYPPDFQSGGAR